MAKKAPDRPLLWLTRKPQGLIPTSAFDADMVGRFRLDTHVVCTIEQPRDDALNRRFHGLAKTVADGIGQDFDSFKRTLIIKAGFYHSVDVFQGLGVQFTAMHISEMGQDQLQELWDRSVEICIREYIPHIRQSDLLETINRYIGLGAAA